MDLMKKIGLAAGLLTALGVAGNAQAHLVTFGWVDNGDSTVTIWGEHWHGDQTSPYTHNGGVTINDDFIVQWAGVQNGTNRDDMVEDGTLTGYVNFGGEHRVSQERGEKHYGNWFYTEALHIGNGEVTMFTGTRCCIDTMPAPQTFDVTGITSVEDGTDPSLVLNEPVGPVASVVEPGSLALLGLGLAGMGFVRRRRADQA